VVMFYTVCAVAGSIILLLQFLMMVMGLDSDQGEIAEVGDDLALGDELVDGHAAVDHSSAMFFGILSFKSRWRP